MNSKRARASARRKSKLQREQRRARKREKDAGATVAPGSLAMKLDGSFEPAESAGPDRASPDHTGPAPAVAGCPQPGTESYLHDDAAAAEQLIRAGVTVFALPVGSSTWQRLGRAFSRDAADRLCRRAKLPCGSEIIYCEGDCTLDWFIAAERVVRDCDCAACVAERQEAKDAADRAALEKDAAADDLAGIDPELLALAGDAPA
jgi:hypothetical protein